MNEGVFDKSIVSAHCQYCGRKNERTVGWMRRHSDTECDNCAERFSVLKPELVKHASDVDRTMTGLRAMLRSRENEKPEEPEKRRRGWFSR